MGSSEEILPPSTIYAKEHEIVEEKPRAYNTRDVSPRGEKSRDVKGTPPSSHSKNRPSLRFYFKKVNVIALRKLFRLRLYTIEDNTIFLAEFITPRRIM